MDWPGLGKVIEFYASSYLMTLLTVSPEDAGYLENESMEVWGERQQERQQRGEVQGNKCHMWAVGQAASVSKVHVKSSVMYVHSGVAPSVITQSGWPERGLCNLCHQQFNDMSNCVILTVRIV